MSLTGLRPLCDLAQVGAGWGPVERGELARPVYLLLVSARDLLGLAVPPETLAALRPADPLPEDLLDCYQRSAISYQRSGDPLARLRHFLWHLFLPRHGRGLQRAGQLAPYCLWPHLAT
jgi:hypothetical protein